MKKLLPLGKTLLTIFVPPLLLWMGCISNIILIDIVNFFGTSVAPNILVVIVAIVISVIWGLALWLMAIMRRNNIDRSLNLTLLFAPVLMGIVGITIAITNTGASIERLIIPHFADRQLISAMSPICAGESIATVQTLGSETNSDITIGLVLIGHRLWPDYIPDHWRATTLENTQLLACIDSIQETIETCRYYGATITRKQWVLTIDLIIPNTGETFIQHEMRGSLPEACPDVTSSGGIWSGESISFVVFRDWLRQYLPEGS